MGQKTTFTPSSEFLSQWNKSIFGQPIQEGEMGEHQRLAMFFAWIGWNMHKESVKEKEIKGEDNE